MFFGILYKKLNPTLAEHVLNSEITTLYNRKNPQQAIRSLAHIPVEKTKLLMQAKKAQFESMELEIKDQVVQKIITNEKLSEEDRLMQIQSMDKFFAFLDNRIWYLYFIVYQSSFRDQIIDLFASEIASYIDLTQMSTHLATILMELLQNAEKAHFEQLLYKNHMVNSEQQLFKFLKDKKSRAKAVLLARNSGQNIELGFRFHFHRATANLDNMLEVFVKNQGAISYNVERQLANKLDTDTKANDLASFFQESGDEQLGAGLGLLYISYLKEECKKANMRFSSQIFAEKKHRKNRSKITDCLLTKIDQNA